MAIAPTPFDDAPRVVHDLYERHAPALRAFCLRSLRNRDDADEAVQATFLRALGAVRSGVRPVSERAWLLTIARNVCATRATCAHRRREVAFDSLALEHAAGAAASPDLGADAELVAALEALPEGQRRAFVLRAVDGLSYEEIAHELGVTHAAVETWIFRARRTLAEAVADHRRRLAADLSSVAAALKSLLTGGAALKAGVAAVAAIGLGSAIAVAPNDAAPPPRRVPISPAVRTPAFGTPALAKRVTRPRTQEPRTRPTQRTAAAATPPAPPTTSAPAPSAQPVPQASSSGKTLHPDAKTTTSVLPPTPLDPVVEPIHETLAPITDQLPLPALTEPVQALPFPPLPVEAPPTLPLP